MQCEKCGKKVYANEKCECGQKAPKRHNVAVRINTVVCFILVLVVTLCLILTLSLRKVVNDGLLSEAVEKVELKDLEVSDGKKLDQYIYDEFINDERITVENVDKLLEEPFIKDFLTDKIDAYQDYLLDEGDLPYITTDEVIKLIEDNEQLIYDEVGLRFLEPDKAELRENLSALDDFEKYSKDKLDDTYRSKLAQTFFSYANVVFLIVLLAVLLIQWLMVYIFNQRRGGAVLSWYGLAVQIPSAFILLTLLTLVVDGDAEFADKLIGPAKTPFAVYSAVMLSAGIVLNILGAVFGRKKKYSTVNNPEPVVTPVQPKAPVKPAETPVQPIESAPKKICPECSYENKETAAFCSHCGKKLAETEVK